MDPLLGLAALSLQTPWSHYCLFSSWAWSLLDWTDHPHTLLEAGVAVANDRDSLLADGRMHPVYARLIQLDRCAISGGAVANAGQ